MQNKIRYVEKDGILYPDVELPQQKNIGTWGQLHLRWIKRYRIARYTELLMSGELNEYLYRVNEEAQNCFDSIFMDLSEQYNLSEELKARDQMKWVGLANYIAKAAREIVEREVIFV